jgi:hypothetical protein
LLLNSFLYNLEIELVSEVFMLEKYRVPKAKADAFANGVFLISLGILIFTGAWWPGILLAIWAMLAVRQFFTARLYDLIITSVILIGLFFISYFDIHWAILMPVLFVVGGLYLIFREYFFSDEGGLDDDTKQDV